MFRLTLKVKQLSLSLKLKFLYSSQNFWLLIPIWTTLATHCVLMQILKQIITHWIKGELMSSYRYALSLDVRFFTFSHLFFRISSRKFYSNEKAVDTQHTIETRVAMIIWMKIYDQLRWGWAMISWDMSRAAVRKTSPSDDYHCLRSHLWSFKWLFSAVNIHVSKWLKTQQISYLLIF